jgi:methylmalonyl-CoA mutase, C-terminal domain
VRLLLCKPGLDGHDRGVKLLARACRDAGMEVVYGGVRQTVDEIATAAVQEDVDVIGVSNHSGLLVELCQQLVERLEDAGAGHKPIVAGGTLVGSEEEDLTQIGVRAVFGPGSSIDEIVEHISQVAEEARSVDGR